MTSFGPLSDVIRGELERWMRATIARLLDHLGLCHKSMLGYRCHGSNDFRECRSQTKPPLADGRAVLVFRMVDASVASGAVLIKNSLRNSPAAGQFDTVGRCPSADSLQIDIAAAVC
jgi:hypothetical protein